VNPPAEKLTGVSRPLLCLRASRVVVLALLLFVVVGGGSRAAAPPAPVPVGPADGARAGGVPAFAWKGVRAAEQYEFQIAADKRFSSPVLGQGKDDFLTKNTRATLRETIPNGTYWWRVRALAKDGTPSSWSKGRSFTKAWASTTTLESPLDGGVVIYPTQQLRLAWAPVGGARKYLVYLARDEKLTSIVTAGGRPVETNATSFTPNLTLPEGDYFWGVQPVDAEGNRGNNSRIPGFKFTWSWPSKTTMHYTDLNDSPKIINPQLS